MVCIQIPTVAWFLDPICTLTKRVFYLDIGDPGSLFKLVLVEQLHALEGVHGLDKANVFAKLDVSLENLGKQGNIFGITNNISG